MKLTKEFNYLHREFNEIKGTQENKENIGENEKKSEEIEEIEEEIKKVNDILDFSIKKELFLENKLKNIEKSRISLSFLENEKKSLEISNRTLKEKLNLSITSSNENLTKGGFMEKSEKFIKKSSEVQKFEHYFKKLKKLHC